MAEAEKKSAATGKAISLIDESGFMLQPTVRRTWAPVGQTPVSRAWDRRDRWSVLSALTVSPARRRLGPLFDAWPCNVDAGAVLAMLRHLRGRYPGGFVLVLDRWSVHRKAVRQFLALGYGRVEVEWLPAYAPELNPVERVWQRAKHTDLADFVPEQAEHLRLAVEDSPVSTRGQQDILRPFFAYAKLKLWRVWLAVQLSIECVILKVWPFCMPNQHLTGLASMPMEEGKPVLQADRTTTPNARKVMAEWIAKIGDLSAGDLTEHLGMLPALVLKEGLELIPTLFELLDAPEKKYRLVATVMLLCIHGNPNSEIPIDIIGKLFDEVPILLEMDNEFVRATVCSGLLWCQVPKEVLPHVRKLLRCTEPSVAVVAALVILKNTQEELDAYSIVKRSMDAGDLKLSGFVASTLLLLGVLVKPAIRHIRVNILAKAEPSIVRPCLHALGLAGKEGAALISDVELVLADESRPRIIRHDAATALGRMTSDSSRSNDVLMRELRSHDPIICLGTIIGISSKHVLPDGFIASMCRRLCDKNVDIRRHVAYGFGLVADRATECVHFLIERLGEEKNIDVLEQIGTALTAFGKPAIPHLINSIIEGHEQRHRYAGSVLVVIGPDAAEAIVAMFGRADSGRVRNDLISILCNMGAGAGPAIPLLADVFNATEDEALALAIARGVCFAGATATAAIPAFLCRVASRGLRDDVGAWVDRSLWCMRAAAIVQAKQMLESTSASGAEHLRELLRRLEPPGSSPGHRLAAFNCDRLLRRFALVASFLDGTVPLSIRGVVARLEKAAKDGDERVVGESISWHTVSRTLGDLAEILNSGSLTTHRGKKKGTLTPEGRDLWVEIERYFTEKAEFAMANREHAKRSATPE